jgi:hypothetical protein
MANPRKPREKQQVIKTVPADAPLSWNEPVVPTHDEIARRAYYIWKAATASESDPVANWIEAERQAWEEYARGVEQTRSRQAHHATPDERRPDRLA